MGPQICKMNGQLIWKPKYPWPYDYPIANLISSPEIHHARLRPIMRHLCFDNCLFTSLRDLWNLTQFKIIPTSNTQPIYSPCHITSSISTCIYILLILHQLISVFKLINKDLLWSVQLMTTSFHSVPPSSRSHSSS